ncbi:hypothetical protein TWF506_005591 [Arthrobotrys conoides]|uniref:FAD dependent oxidoreductase domain-containing protein n=1 Tax=Arthrobotrys conoides TaxID=74498 RepID=A0AAN8NWT7_9PEZI
MPQNTTNVNTTATHSPSTNPADSSIIILGAGIIGLSTAYYLSSTSSSSSSHNHQKISPQNITVLDTSPTLFACASGRAGGFLARDWFGAASSKLGELSFGLHRQLADANDGRRRWGYSPSNSFSFERGTGEGGRNRGDDWLRDGTSRVDASSGVGGVDAGNVQRGIAPAWWNCEGGKVELSCTGDSTAQLDPHGLCEFLLEEVRRRGVTVRHPVTPVRVIQSAENQLEGLVISNGNGTAEEEVISCSHILIAAGSWSGRLFEKLFPKSEYRLPISSLAGHSIVIRSPAHRPQETESRDLHAVFSSIDGLDWHPEAFSRANGDIYLAGINSATTPLPELATDVKEDDADIQQLISGAKDLIVQFGVGGDDNDGTRNGLTNEANVIRRGLCHRPVTPAGKPILSRVPDALLGELNTKIGGGGGVFVAAGHGPWGISMSLGTGKVMAEMILGRETTVDVSQLGLQ